MIQSRCLGAIALLSLAIPAEARELAARADVPPPVVATASSSLLLMRWLPGPVACDGGDYPAEAVRRPWTALAWGSGGPNEAKTARYRFAIDADGRAHSIVRDGTDFAPYAHDIAPSLAATRFPAGAARRGCVVNYASERLTMADAPIADLISYSVNPQGQELPREGWDRIKPAGATCADAPRPQWLVNVQPDMASLPAEPGARDWTLVGYDLDSDGRPVRAAVVTGTQNAALDRAALQAIGKSRGTGGPRTGCRNPYVRRATTLAPPSSPDPQALQPAGANCAVDGKWETMPPLIFPEPFRRRGIEGWAIVAFDVAPWGGTGNVRAVASEPAAEFGEQAAQMIRNARKPAPATGATGCVTKVKFVMGPDGDVPATRS